MGAGRIAGSGNGIHAGGTRNPASDGDARRAGEALRQLRDALRAAHDRFEDPGARAAAGLADDLLRRLGRDAPGPPLAATPAARGWAASPRPGSADTDPPNRPAGAPTLNGPQAEHLLAAMAGGPNLALAVMLGPPEHLGPFLEAAARHVASRRRRQGGG